MNDLDKVEDGCYAIFMVIVYVLAVVMIIAAIATLFI